MAPTTPANLKTIPEVLFQRGHKPVVAGDVLKVANTDRRVKVLDIRPNDEGQILVEEQYYLDAAEIDCTYQEPRIVIELPPDQAHALLTFWREHASEVGGDDTRSGVFDDLEIAEGEDYEEYDEPEEKPGRS